MTKEEALNEIRSWAIPSKKGREVLETLIPELAESEDERTKKQLIDAIKIGCSNSGISFTKEAADRYIAWLEKQEENTWSEEDDAKVKVMCEEGDLKPSERAWLKDLKNRVWKEQKPAEWSAKGRRGRIGSTPEHIRKKAENFLSKMEPPYDADDICSAYETGAMENANSSWSEEDEKMLRTIISDGSRGVELDSKQISWLKSLRPQPKKELSIEKAIQWLDDTFYFLDNSSGRGRDCEITTHDFDSLEEMYDSFRKAVTVDYRPSWRPSEEQMKALEDAFRKDGSDEYRKTINSLYQDLKKLM